MPRFSANLSFLFDEVPFLQRFGEAAQAGFRAVEFALAYEFATSLLDKVIGPVFTHIANTFIEAFVRRADAVYGNPG